MSSDTEDFDYEDWLRRRDERQALQERLHALNPRTVPKYIPVDDPEFGTEAWTAGWGDEDEEEDDS